jgi:protein phosphatase methylesterase 1
MSGLQKHLLKSKLPPMIPRSPPKHPGRQKDYSPTMWKEYFFDFKDVKLNENNSFRVYQSSKPSEEDDSPVLVCLHGGGFSALSWALFTTEITSIIHCQVLAIDFRGHGKTLTDFDEDLSAETMSRDIGSVIEKLYEGKQAPRILLIGHSMGGAIAVHIANMQLISSLAGIIVIDVVEGTAMDSLQSMQSFLRSRPTNFKSIENAIEWCVRSGQIRNVESAKVSMPSQIVNCETNQLATDELPLPLSDSPAIGISNPMSIPEDAEESSEFQVPISTATAKLASAKKYTWRIDLSQSERFWRGWFENLSDKFLETPCPKLLILAGIDNLDKKLTIGQMQGKFQLQVLARTGHAVHEDQPGQVAETIGSYLIRNKFAHPKNDFVRVMPAC